MTDEYARFFTDNSTLLTCTVIGREPVLQEAAVHLLRAILGRVKRSHPFRTLGYVFLPDHVHLLVAPDTGTDLHEIVDEMKRSFTLDYQQIMGIPGKMAVWQPGFRSHAAQTVDAFAGCLDFIHYNPVHHGKVDRPENWPHSSYQHWVERRLYKLGWGWTLPERLAHMRME